MPSDSSASLCIFVQEGNSDERTRAQRRQRVRHGNTGLERIAAWKCHAVRGAVSVSQACCAALMGELGHSCHAI
jgi:hypothetical protein